MKLTKSILKILIILTLFSGFCACGRKGALYLEDETPTKTESEKKKSE